MRQRIDGGGYGYTRYVMVVVTSFLAYLLSYFWYAFVSNACLLSVVVLPLVTPWRGK